MTTFWTRKRTGSRRSKTKYSESERKDRFKLRLAHAWFTRKSLFGPSGISPEGREKLANREQAGVESYDELVNLDWSELDV